MEIRFVLRDGDSFDYEPQSEEDLASVVEQFANPVDKLWMLSNKDIVKEIWIGKEPTDDYKNTFDEWREMARGHRSLFSNN